MYTKTRLLVYPFLAIGFLFALNSCHKSEGDNPGPAASKGADNTRQNNCC